MSIYSLIDGVWGEKRISPVPSDSELAEYYRLKYFQADHAQYSKLYSTEERRWRLRKCEFIKSIAMENLAPHSLLDIGAGEGWNLSYFKQIGWEVSGIDFSRHACEMHNPDVASALVVADPARQLKLMDAAFGVVVLENVIEHVTDPASLLRDAGNRLLPEGILVAQVPNDFSEIQTFYLESGIVKKPYWVVPPEHISYFNRDSLIKLLEHSGFEVVDVLADFPIDLMLLNDNSNYINSPECGPSAHRARMRWEEFIHGLDFRRALEVCRNLSASGFGRSLMAICKHRISSDF